MGDCNSFILSGLWGIDGRVLIVPSGIETFFLHLGFFRSFVLIVPSGIETKWDEAKKFLLAPVLIVPSGIETNRHHNHHVHPSVLIVPSGIETKEHMCQNQ